MASVKDPKQRFIDVLADSLSDDTSREAIAVQRIYEAFDSFSQPGQQTRRNRVHIAECLPEVWVTVSRAFVGTL